MCNGWARWARPKILISARRLPYRPAKIDNTQVGDKHRYQGTRYSQLSAFGLTFQICEICEKCEMYEEKLNEDDKTIVKRRSKAQDSTLGGRATHSPASNHHSAALTKDAAKYVRGRRIRNRRQRSRPGRLAGLRRLFYEVDRQPRQRKSGYP